MMGSLKLRSRAAWLTTTIVRAGCVMMVMCTVQWLGYQQVFAADGVLDSGFGTGGIVKTVFGGFDSLGAIALQPDGKIVAAGITLAPSPLLVLARYNPNGSLDNTFGFGGKVSTSILQAAASVLIQPDGKIVVAGTGSIGPGSHQVFSVTRFLTNGALDTSFGVGGVAITDLGGQQDQLSFAVLQEDGKVVAGGSGGTTSSPAASKFALVRYNSNGTLDSTFGGGGVVMTAIGNDGVITALALEPDGAIIAGGSANGFFIAGIASGPDTGIASNAGFVVARYIANGTLDSTFGTGGVVLTNLGGTMDTLQSIALQPDGRIVAVGSTNEPGNSAFKFAVVRYESNGALDPTFGAAGVAVLSAGTFDFLDTVALQPDGKILCGGLSIPKGLPSGNADFALLRLSSGGALDTAFGSAGYVLGLPGASFYTARSIAFQPDGKFVVGANSPVAGSHFVLARFTGFTSFDKCLRDDASGNWVQFNSTTGAYLFTNCGTGGFTLGGQGTIRRVGSILTITDSEPDRRVSIGYVTNQLTGRATIIRTLSQGVYLTYSINDTNIHPVCSCQ